MLIRYAIFTWRIPLPLVLQPVLIGFIAYLLWDPTFQHAQRAELQFLLAHAGLDPRRSSLLSARGMTALCDDRDARIASWSCRSACPACGWSIMLLYPLLSVIPQELIYRTFFFHRYGPLFGEARWLAIAVNGLLFGFAHVIFGSYVSIVLTAFLGCLVAWRYDETRSFWAVWLEHSLYGCLVFTIGLGHYFFTGIATLP